MAEVKTLLTADDLWRMPHGRKRYELVKGELIEMAPVGGEHGDVAAELTVRLRTVVKQRRLGKVVIEVGFCLECRPDTVRGPDVAFLSADRIPPESLPKAFFPGAPDLAVEVISPYETAREVLDKVQDYLAHGTRLVWTMEPGTRTIMAYRPDGSARLLRAEDTLSGEDVVPGFEVKVAELFE